MSILEKFKKAYDGNKNNQEKLQKEIKEVFERKTSSVNNSQQYFLLASDEINETIERLADPRKIICDCPCPAYGADDDEKLKFIPEPQKFQRNYYVRTAAGERVSDVWNGIYYELMNIVSKGRVFCHPDIRDALMAAIGPGDIRECSEKVIRGG